MIVMKRIEILRVQIFIHIDLYKFYSILTIIQFRALATKYQAATINSEASEVYDTNGPGM